MDVAIRTDASRLIGTGHVMRCCTLARELRRRGARVRFVCREHPGNLSGVLRELGFEVLALPPPSVAPDVAASDDYATWLGASEEEDAAQTLQALGAADVDWLVVDHYGLGAAWERRLRDKARRILVVDDLEERVHDCDILLDQNRPYAMAARARGARALGGPAFALLRDDFRKARATPREHTGEVRRILVFFGGADPTRETEKAVAALANLAPAQVAIDVIVGQVSDRFDAVERLCATRGNATVHRAVAHVEKLMLDADLAIGACGATTWERCCLGLPAITASIAQNQVDIGRELVRHRAALYLGPAQDLDVATWERVIARVVARPRLVARLARRAAELVDGAGTRRVAAAMMRALELTVVSDAGSWINGALATLVEGWRADGHAVRWVHDPAEVGEGDCAFYLSCSRIARAAVLARNGNNLVVHESDLPRGRGWSPLTWHVLEGADTIPVTLFEAAADVDSGPVYLQEPLRLQGHELVDELRRMQADATIALCRRFVDSYPDIVATARAQGGEPSYYPRRRPEDSRLDPTRPLETQFDLLRVVDNERYPAYFELRGQRYVLRISKSTEGSN